MNLIIIQTAVFWFMAGITWVLQRLNYPLLGEVGADTLPTYQANHNKRFGLLMMPGVLISTITIMLLFFLRPLSIPLAVPVCQLLLLLCIVASAAKHAAPAHKKLEQGFDQHTHQLLILTNRLRLAAWLVLSVGDVYLLIANSL